MRSVLEESDESLGVEISPVVHLNFLVKGLELLLDGILGGGDHELLLGVDNVGSVHQEDDL